MTTVWDIDSQFYFSNAYYQESTNTYATLIEYDRKKPMINLEYSKAHKAYKCPHCDTFFDRNIDCVHRHALHCCLEARRAGANSCRGWWGCGKVLRKE